ncbi:MAG: ABC transporter permease [Saprospiraceae bacterium]|nr:ABC transporter permease [Saprospiraceae bacterium]
MFKNYFKIALRHLLKERRYTFINLTGLAIGVAVALLMFLFVKEEWTYDHFHDKADQIYRVWVKEHYQGEIFFNTTTPYVLGRELAENFPEIEAVPRYTVGGFEVREGQLTEQEEIHLVNPDFFEAFDFQSLAGDPVRSLNELRTTVITTPIAKKYFGEENPIGKTLSIQLDGDWEAFEVGAIVESPPTNSSHQFSMLIPFDNIKAFVSERTRNHWQVVAPETYILLKEGQSLAALTKKVQSHVDDKVAGIYEAGEYEVGFQPLKDIHLNNEMPGGIVSVSDSRYPYIMGGVAILILLLAGINFVTLSVGRSVTRAKEVGVRKVSGANRKQLMMQFWSEAILISLGAVVIGVILARVVLPYFNDMAGKSLSIDFSLLSVMTLLSFGVGLGLLAGIYPALVTSGYAPKLAFQDMVSSLGSRKNMVLRGLIGFQFILSVVLIASTMIMQKQLRFIQNANLGFDKEQVLSFRYNSAPGGGKTFADRYQEGIQKAEILKRELEQNPDVLEVATSSHAFGVPGWMQVGYTDPNQKFRWFTKLTVDDQFLPMMGVALESGRHFSKEVGADTRTAIIINRAMADLHGIEAAEEQMPTPFEAFHLIGITENFNYSSLHNAIEPLMISMDPVAINEVVTDVNYSDSPMTKISVKLSGGDLTNTVEGIQSAWEKVAPEQEFNFAFVDENLDRMYRAEMRLGTVMQWATLLAILIACMGLFGMATLILARKTKEIGVRKVLGASSMDILVLLNRPFTWLVVIANLIGAPIAYYFMQSWLADFAYRTNVNVLLFVLVGLMALVIAWIAVSWQAIRATRLNPVEALRYE